MPAGRKEKTNQICNSIYEAAEKQRTDKHKSDPLFDPDKKLFELMQNARWRGISYAEIGLHAVGFHKYLQEKILSQT
jgi:hypothetical protein